MAIIPGALFPDNTDPASAEYPYGKARNIVTAGDNTGTPLDQAWVNDLWGYMAAKFSAANMAPTGLPDTAQASQHMEALKRIIGKLSEIGFDTVADLRSSTSKLGAIDATVLAGYRVRWDGCYSPSDGGGNWGTIKIGAHTDDGGSIFSLGANVYVEANLKGQRVGARKFGLINDGTGAATNNAVMASVVAYVLTYPVGSRPKIRWGSGIISYSTSPNWAYKDLTSEGGGSGATRFNYSGTGKAWDIDAAAFGLSFVYGVDHKGFLIDAGADGTHGVYEEIIAHSKYKDVMVINGKQGVCIHWEQALTVLNEYNSCGSTVNRFTTTSKPAECLRLRSSPAKGQKTTANVYTNWIAEGATSTGIYLLQADGNTFVGGTSEANTGRAITIGAACRSNTFNNLFMEANTNGDILDTGNSTNWNNCFALSSFGSSIVNGAIGTRIIGGQYEKLNINTGVIGAAIEDIQVNFTGSGSFSDNGTSSVVRNIYDKTVGAFITSAALKGARTSITVTASPFDYINNTTQLQQVIVRNGTISQIQYIRGADVNGIVAGGGEGGNPNGVFLLSAGDGLRVTYSVAPTMNAIPMGVANL